MGSNGFNGNARKAASAPPAPGRSLSFKHLRLAVFTHHVRAMHGTGEPFTGLGLGIRVVLEQHLGEG
jgi:hypothetical protein